MLENQADGVPDAATTWRRVRRAVKNLFDVLADIDEMGGVGALADEELWTEAEVARAVADMMLVRRMLLNEVSRLRGTSADRNDFPSV